MAARTTAFNVIFWNKKLPDESKKKVFVILMHFTAILDYVYEALNGLSCADIPREDALLWFIRKTYSQKKYKNDMGFIKGKALYPKFDKQFYEYLEGTGIFVVLEDIFCDMITKPVKIRRMIPYYFGKLKDHGLVQHKLSEEGGPRPTLEPTFPDFDVDILAILKIDHTLPLYYIVKEIEVIIDPLDRGFGLGLTLVKEDKPPAAGSTDSTSGASTSGSGTTSTAVIPLDDDNSTDEDPSLLNSADEKFLDDPKIWSWDNEDGDDVFGRLKKRLIEIIDDPQSTPEPQIQGVKRPGSVIVISSDSDDQNEPIDLALQKEKAEEDPNHEPDKKDDPDQKPVEKDDNEDKKDQTDQKEDPDKNPEKKDEPDQEPEKDFPNIEQIWGA